MITFSKGDIIENICEMVTTDNSKDQKIIAASRIERAWNLVTPANSREFDPHWICPRIYLNNSEFIQLYYGKKLVMQVNSFVS